MAFTFNGVGTKFHGKRDLGNDGSYVTTEWFVFLCIPVFPIRSLRVLPTGEGSEYVVYSSWKYHIQRVALNGRQV